MKVLVKKTKIVNVLLSFLVSFLISGLCSAETRFVRSLKEIRQQNIVMQEWDLSCGAATLTTLLRYQYGDQVTEKQVALGLIDRDIYIANPDLVKLRQGFSLLDLKRYVDRRGYQGQGFGKMTIDDLVKRAPVIVPISVFGYNHFVIFRGRLRDRVLLADPAWGNRTMTVAEFGKAWIEYQRIGKVGFIVESGSKVSKKNGNAFLAQAADFATFN